MLFRGDSETLEEPNSNRRIDKFKYFGELDNTMVIVHSLHWTRMKGRICSCTFQKGKGSISMHYCTKTEQPGKGGQVTQRNKYRVAMEKWRSILRSQQEHLREYCLENLTKYSGCNLFVKGSCTIPACRLIIDDLDPETNLRYCVVMTAHPLLKYVKVMNDAETVTYWEAGAPLEV